MDQSNVKLLWLIGYKLVDYISEEQSFCYVDWTKLDGVSEMLANELREKVCFGSSVSQKIREADCKSIDVIFKIQGVVPAPPEVTYDYLQQAMQKGGKVNSIITIKLLISFR